ncbi:MAG: Fic family protein [Enterobacteriaceae bacterium]
MTLKTTLLNSIRASYAGMTLAELLVKHPGIARRTAQRLISQLVESEQITAVGKGRARHYVVSRMVFPPHFAEEPGKFPAYIPLSADSRDIVAYLEQPLPARNPVGYQRDFLEEYQPNQTAYLPDPIRRQLHQIGMTVQAGASAGTYSRSILGRLLIDLSWASSHLEGNTYSRLDTRRLIEQGKIARGKAMLETQMILNHKAAIELLVGNVDTLHFDRYMLMNLHGVLAENLLSSPEDEGRIRQHEVGIGQSVYRPLSAPQLINDSLDLLLNKAEQISDPFEQSFFMMVHLPYLQPFADINKRTSRLAANLPLFRANLCPLTFLGVSQYAYSRAMLGIYEMTRVELLRDLYVWAYGRSTQEYLTIKQGLVEPDAMRLKWRELIREIIHAVIIQPDQDAFMVIRQRVNEQVPETERDYVQALIIEELRLIHEGVLVRYGIRPSELQAWQTKQR